MEDRTSAMIESNSATMRASPPSSDGSAVLFRRVSAFDLSEKSRPTRRRASSPSTFCVLRSNLRSGGCPSVSRRRPPARLQARGRRRGSRRRCRLDAAEEGSRPIDVWSGCPATRFSARVIAHVARWPTGGHQIRMLRSSAGEAPGAPRSDGAPCGCGEAPATFTVCRTAVTPPAASADARRRLSASAVRAPGRESGIYSTTAMTR